MTQAAMIQVDGLSYRYPGATRNAIDALSLRVARGALFGLLGPNGSGKTTLAALLMDLLTPAAGHIRIGTEGNRPRVALVPQEYAFYTRLSVIENLHFFAGVQGVKDEARIASVIATAGLEDWRDTRAAHLSGGLKRRLNLAIGLLAEPELLLLDEPTVGIDPQSRHFILEAIRRINANGATVVYSSHYMEEVQALCSEIGILDRGRLLATGSLDELLGQAGDSTLLLGLEREPDRTLAAALRAMDGVSLDGRDIRLPHCSPAQLRDLLARLDQAGVEPGRLRYGHADLEALFLHLTGHQLRD